MIAVDQNQQKLVNEAAEKFAGAIDNLRTQAESNRALADDLIEQQRKQQEASQALAQGGVNAYMDFLPCSPTTRGTWTRPRRGPGGRRRATRPIRKARTGWFGP